MARLFERYQQEIQPRLAEKLGRPNRLALPRLVKIVVNTGLGRALEDRKILDEAVATLSHVTGQRPVLTLARNHGQFTAVYAGVERARAEVVATIEAHPDHAVEDVLRLAARLTGAADVVHGVRRGRHARWWRKVGSRGLNLALRGLGVTPVRDIGFMLMVWRRPVALEAFRRPDFGHYLWALQGRRIVNVAVRCDHASQRPSAYRLPTLVACGLSALRAGVAIRRGRPRGAGGDDAPEYEVLERG